MTRYEAEVIAKVFNKYKGGFQEKADVAKQLNEEATVTGFRFQINSQSFLIPIKNGEKE